MSLLRLIARLDIKGPNVVKGIQMEGLRVMGKPMDIARRYAEDCDELLYIDTVASLYGRNQLTQLLEETTDEIFVPVTVGGGIRNLGDVQRLLNAGADKVAINTAAVAEPALVQRIADRYGSQCIVGSIEAKRVPGGWEAYTDNGRQRTGKDAVQWAVELAGLGAGEILVTSVDQDGTQKGFDLDLMKAITPNVDVPVVVCGGMGTIGHMLAAIEVADAVAMASCLHYGKITFKEMRDAIENAKNTTRGADPVPQRDAESGTILSGHTRP